MLQLEHVSKNYGSIRAVDDLNFVIKDRQVVGLLGMNGAGKSTTLNMITGCTAPSSGNILINGHNIIDDHRDAKREFGYLPEIVPLYDEMTVEEYLRFVCELKEIVSKYISKHICDICEIVGIRDIMKRPVVNLSKGLRQRVGIAQALCGNPPVIILDEPAIGLDPVQTISFRRMIRTLSQEHTIIISSHILSEIQEVCGRFIILHHGRNVYDSDSDTEQKLSRKIYLRAKSTQDSLISVVRSIDGVLSVKPAEDALDSNDDCYPGIIITVSNDAEAFEDRLFHALYSINAPVYEMSARDESLEDIFVRLTK